MDKVNDFGISQALLLTLMSYEIHSFMNIYIDVSGLLETLPILYYCICAVTCVFSATL